MEQREPLTRPAATLSPSDGERDGVRGRSEIFSENHSSLFYNRGVVGFTGAAHA
jgi:hypothetical protein